MADVLLNEQGQQRLKLSLFKSVYAGVVAPIHAEPHTLL